ncbi:uncharacterized protein LOC129584435 [Paramacrobiotus metropolitanus]|uniref:uncharacterized protein LOC129584435 n=1 Tax=Paramacrobiotus metropolitanus TaxID=2943436 RepID=UPI002445B9EA|nr:uncharacterized protein LOC129584435 [Paramacrobiotus metropolitanus]
MFPYKPPSKGLYPYYPNCVYRNFTFNFFCYDPKNSSISVNSFVTGLWDDDNNFFTWRPVADDSCSMKCCTTPKGYYIDYASCYYVSTHDQFGEYYDSNFNFIVTCAHGHVMTGISKKMNANTATYRVDWIQCCRLGYGIPHIVSPPVISGHSGHPAYYAAEPYTPAHIPNGYQAQYRTLPDATEPSTNTTRFSATRVWFRNKPQVEETAASAASGHVVVSDRL